MESAKLTMRMLEEVSTRAKSCTRQLKEAIERGDGAQALKLQSELADLHERSDAYASELLAHFERLERAKQFH